MGGPAFGLNASYVFSTILVFHPCRPICLDAQELVELVRQGCDAIFYHGGVADDSEYDTLRTRDFIPPKVCRTLW